MGVVFRSIREIDRSTKYLKSDCCCGNGHARTAKSNGSAAAGSGDDLDARILGMEKAVGPALFRGILREYGRVNQPKLIRDAAIKRKVLQMLESATRGIDRLEAVSKRLDPDTVKGLLEELQVPPLNEIADIKNPAKRCPRTRRTRWPESSRCITTPVRRRTMLDSQTRT